MLRRRARWIREHLPVWWPLIVYRWGQEDARCETPNPLSRDSTLFVHYSASDGEPVDARGEPRAAAKGIQHHHMNVKGWCDAGYSGLLVQPRGIFRRPIVFWMRGYGKVPAAQEGHNTGNGAICVLADPDDRIKWRTRRALRVLARRFPGRHVRGHKDVVATACPGPYLYSLVPGLDQVAKRPKWRTLP